MADHSHHDHGADAPRFAGLSLPTSPFAGDDGTTPSALAAAIAAWANGEVSLDAVQRALVGARLMVPVVPVLGETEIGPDGLVIDKTSDLQTVSFQAEAGWEALLAFTSVENAITWRADARPVPNHAEQVAAEALERGCAVILLDFAGPVRVPISGRALRALSQGRPLVDPFEDPDVREAATAAATAIAHVRAAEIEAPGEYDADFVLVVTTDHPDTQAVGQAVSAALAAVPVLRDRLDKGAAVMVIESTPEAP